VIVKARGRGLAKDDNFPHLVSGDNSKIVDKPPTIFHLDPKADARHRLDVERVFAAYRKGLNPDRQRLLDRFTMKDLALKAVGVGSVGTFCCVALVHDRRQRALVLAGQTSAAIGIGTARRQACLQRKSRPSGCRGPTDDAGRQRHLPGCDAGRCDRPSVLCSNRRLGAVSEISEGEALSDYAQLCGRTLARAHARSGDPAAIAGYTGKSDALDDAIASFATAYADQTSADHIALVKAKGTKPTATKKAKAA
jgi:hypothetical protein